MSEGPASSSNQEEPAMFFLESYKLILDAGSATACEWTGLDVAFSSAKMRRQEESSRNWFQVSLLGPILGLCWQDKSLPVMSITRDDGPVTMTVDQWLRSFLLPFICSCYSAMAFIPNVEVIIQFSGQVVYTGKTSRYLVPCAYVGQILSSAFSFVRALAHRYE